MTDSTKDLAEANPHEEATYFVAQWMPEFTLGLSLLIIFVWVIAHV